MLTCSVHGTKHNPRKTKMRAQDILASTYQTSSFVLRSYFDDLSDAELMHRPGPGCNHLAWQLGHLIVSEVSLLNSVCPGAGAELPAGFADRYKKETAGNDSPQAFDTKDEYLRLLELNQAAALKAISEVSDARLEEPAPESLRAMFPTVAAVLILIATHGLMHAGQFVPVRRALSKPIVI
ncbi:MAG: DinB family protein [Planctomycetaceae bacterium]